MGDVISNAFEKEVVRRTAFNIRKKRWLSDARFFNNLIDLYLAELLQQQENVDKVLTLIQKPQVLYALVMENLIALEISMDMSKNIWTAFRTYIQRAIINANQSTIAYTDSELDKVKILEIFFSSLFKELKHGGPENDHLADAFITVCCGESRNPYSSERQETSKILVTSNDFFTLLEQRKSPENRKDFLKEISSKVLDYISTNFSTFPPRCNSYCPICRSLCMEMANHDTEKQPHDTIHQPRGLVGVHHPTDGELITTTCSEFKEHEGFFMDRRIDPLHHRHSFKDFSQLYPGWKTPSIGQDLQLRKYILATYNKDIAKKYGVKPCRDIPPNYSWDLYTIQEQLKLLTNTKYCNATKMDLESFQHGIQF